MYLFWHFVTRLWMATEITVYSFDFLSLWIHLLVWLKGLHTCRCLFISNILKKDTIKFPLSVLYVFFLKRQEHSSHFLLGEIVFYYWEHFKGTKAMARGHGGNRPCCLSEWSTTQACHVSNCRENIKKNCHIYSFFLSQER